MLNGNLKANQRRMVVTNEDDDDIIGIFRPFHGSNNIDVELDGNLEVGERLLLVSKEVDDDINGIDETFHDNNIIDAELNVKRGVLTVVVYGSAETFSIGITSPWELTETVVCPSQFFKHVALKVPGLSQS